jgi:soluble lytic murein transglycosylase
MIFKYFLSLSLAGLALPALLATAAWGKTFTPEESVLAAFDAYRAGDALKLEQHAKRAAGHVLVPWIDYWRVAMRLEDASTADVRAFLNQHRGTYVAELLVGDWLKVLGRRSDWQEFEREAAHYNRDDLEITCYRWLARIARGDDSALAEAPSMWLEPKELPEGCARVVDMMLARDRVSVTDIWQRVRELFENGQIIAAKTALGYLPKDEAPAETALAEAARQPKRHLERLPKTLDRHAMREVAVLAGIRHARNDPEAMAEALQGPLSTRLPPADLKYLWGRVAHEGARIHHEDALKWYARAGDARLDDDQLAWKVRAALRRAHWQTVRDAIDDMSPEARRDPTWVYWYGRALAAQGEETGARSYYLRVAGQLDFYGLLASEELGYVAALPAVVHVPTEEEVEAAKRNPGLARALELIRLGVRTEGVREWLFAIRNFDDRQLLAAAELALRAEVYDRTIHTADRTVRTHNFDLRYPVPFRDMFRDYAKSHGVDKAFVLGLVRQESRFIAEARSGAGAAGLMQVMPNTARYVAGRMKMRGYKAKDIHDIETNIKLGSGYLKLVLDQLGHQVLASAAYNAGPSRARRWRDARPLEGAIYAETIPFPETREYVKKVMTNSVFYAAVLDKQLTPLKPRLGIVAARNGAEPALEEDLP